MNCCSLTGVAVTKQANKKALQKLHDAFVCSHGKAFQECMNASLNAGRYSDVCFFLFTPSTPLIIQEKNPEF